MIVNKAFAVLSKHSYYVSYNGSTSYLQQFKHDNSVITNISKQFFLHHSINIYGPHQLSITILINKLDSIPLNLPHDQPSPQNPSAAPLPLIYSPESRKIPMRLIRTSSARARVYKEARTSGAEDFCSPHLPGENIPGRAPIVCVCFS